MRNSIKIIDRKVGVKADLKNITVFVGGLLLILPVLTALLLLFFKLII